MSAAGDPFYVVKDELSEKVSALHSRHSTFKRLLETTNTATSAEFKECRKGGISCTPALSFSFRLILSLMPASPLWLTAFARELKSAEKQMRDLTLTVDLVKNDRQQFPHIDGEFSCPFSQSSSRPGQTTSKPQQVMSLN